MGKPILFEAPIRILPSNKIQMGIFTGTINRDDSCYEFCPHRDKNTCKVLKESFEDKEVAPCLDWQVTRGQESKIFCRNMLKRVYFNIKYTKDGCICEYLPCFNTSYCLPEYDKQAVCECPFVVAGYKKFLKK